MVDSSWDDRALVNSMSIDKRAKVLHRYLCFGYSKRDVGIDTRIDDDTVNTILRVYGYTDKDVGAFVKNDVTRADIETAIRYFIDNTHWTSKQEFNDYVRGLAAERRSSTRKHNKFLEVWLHPEGGAGIGWLVLLLVMLSFIHTEKLVMALNLVGVYKYVVWAAVGSVISVVLGWFAVVLCDGRLFCGD